MSKQSTTTPPEDEGTLVPKLDLKSIERKTYAAYHRDGMDEIAGGIFVIMMCRPLLKAGGEWLGIFEIPVFWLAFVLLGFARQRITFPRIGYVEPSARRQSWTNFLGWAAFAIAVALVLYGVLARIFSGLYQAVGDFLQSIHPLDYALFPLLAMVGAGWLTANARWFAYSALTLACLAAAWLLHADLLWGLGAAGVLIVLSGSVVLWRFIRSHPVLSGDAASGIDDGPSNGGAL